MSIRIKIILNIVLFILIILTMGMSFFYFNNKQFEHVNIAYRNIEKRELMKKISDIFSEQVQAYDYFVYLSEKPSKLTFFEKRDELLKEIKMVADMDELDETIVQIKSLNSKFKEAINMVEKGKLSLVVARMEKNIFIRSREIKEQFKNIILRIDQKINISKSKAISYQKRIASISSIVFIIVIFIISIFSMNLYRTISVPLRKLEKAAYMIGQGKMDYKIEIKEKNEFSKIAVAFNQMTKDLKEFYSKITQMGKMASIGELAGGVAHEINNPLTGILGHAQMLLNKLSPGGDVHSTIKKIERAAIRCRDIVGDLLDFSRQDEYKLQKVSINKTLDDTFLFCESEMISKNIKLIKKYKPGLPLIKISRRTIQQAFLNIISNSIQSMKSGGKLAVSTNIESIDGKQYLQIKFIDTGCGFDKEIASRMFDPFFTTRDVGEGTGLGLSLTYKILKRHGGFIKVESKGRGKGAICTIQLPVIARHDSNM